MALAAVRSVRLRKDAPRNKADSLYLFPLNPHREQAPGGELEAITTPWPVGRTSSKKGPAPRMLEIACRPKSEKMMSVVRPGVFIQKILS